MRVISNSSSNHGTLFSELLHESCDELFLVSPYLTDDFEALIGIDNISSVNIVTLVTKLKKNDPDQISKPKSLKSFYKLIRKKCQNAKINIHIDNNLHGKIYIFKKGKMQRAIITSANLTQNGLYNNHEWGLQIDDIDVISQLQNEVLECIDYPDITESLVDRLLMYSDQYQRHNPEWMKNVVPEADILEDVYNEGVRNNKEPRYYLKPVGVSEDPIYKEDQRDFSDLHQDLHFSVKGVGSIRAGDIVITTAVGCGCLLSYFQVTGSPVQATYEEQQTAPWRQRWPWHIEGRNLSRNYGGSWWEYDLYRKALLDSFLEQYPNEAVTQSGSKTLGTLNFGNDKVTITKPFAEFLISKIREVDESSGKS
jgi:hypothetical protein